ncbi:hypothetical protein P4H61_16675 [Paenibacillus peoriae]|uniref:ECs_2282 family putative zinc-binding protein n=1 Tax=Paenibacillus peoriae TaxID=59893 RepID=UPI00026C6173|nr:hypothetical protein [Paenibacillus peoriae]MEC0183122.1 hypothetical protein [Paenibacillus peoriae]
MKEFEESISMNCSVCGNDQFSIIDDRISDLKDASDETKIKCSDCGNVTTKEQLIEDNSYKINANIEDFKEDIAKQVIKDIRKFLK